MVEKKKNIKIDVLKHFLNPKMEVMDKKEVGELLKTYNITLEQLPLIYETDPAVKALNAKKGDVIKIYRKDQTKDYLYYRLVV